jgi:hypothetical protein
MKQARKASVHRKVIRRSPPLSLAQRIERLEKQMLFKSPQMTRCDSIQRFVNLGADGKPTTGDHVAVLQTATGLIWTAAPLNGAQEMNHAEAIKSASDLDLLGKNDWRLSTIQELLSIIDYERWNPAVDPAHFKGPYGWTWTSTLVKGEGAPSGYARSVYLLNGSSFWFYRDSLILALAVRASQQLGLLA